MFAIFYIWILSFTYFTVNIIQMNPFYIIFTWPFWQFCPQNCIPSSICPKFGILCGMVLHWLRHGTQFTGLVVFCNDWIVIRVSCEMSNGCPGWYDTGCTFLIQNANLEQDALPAMSVHPPCCVCCKGVLSKLIVFLVVSSPRRKIGTPSSQSPSK